MSIEIVAKGINFTDDGYGTLLAFADDPNDPRRIVMLDYTNEPDEQDRRLGLAGVHLDTGELGFEGYDLVTDVRRTERGILVVLKPSIGQEIEAVFEGTVIDDLPVTDIVERFQQRLRTSAATSAQPIT